MEQGICPDLLGSHETPSETAQGDGLETVLLLPADLRRKHIPPTGQPAVVGNYGTDAAEPGHVQLPILLSNRVRLHFQFDHWEWRLHSLTRGPICHEEELHIYPLGIHHSTLLGADKHRRLERRNTTGHKAVLLGEDATRPVAPARQDPRMKSQR